MNKNETPNFPSNPERETRKEIIERGDGFFSVEYLEGEESDGEIVELTFTRDKDRNGNKIDKPFTINITDLIPESYILKEDISFKADDAFKEVRFPKGALEIKDSITILIHEIGHAVFHLAEIEAGRDSEGLTSPEEERAAWAFALKVIRQFRLDDKMAEDSWDDLDALRNFVYTCLKTYADGRDDEGFVRGRDFEEVDLSDLQELQQRGFDDLLRQIQERMDKRKNG